MGAFKNPLSSGNSVFMNPFYNVFDNSVTDIKLKCPNCKRVQIRRRVKKSKENSTYYCSNCNVVMQRIFT